MSNKDIEKYVELLPEKVKENVDIVDMADFGQDYFLHISPDKTVKVYTPMISRKQAHTEDRTTPRITCAPTLFGCIIGYCVAHIDMMNFEPTEKYKRGDFKQGWIINKIPAKLALKPTNRMVYDSSRSDEHWLVTYDKDTVYYKAETIGKLFIYSISFVSRTDNYSQLDLVLYVEINDTKGLRFSKNFELKKGYYKIEVEDYSNASSCWDKDKNVTVKEITKEEYKEKKSYSAAMLSEKPPALKW